MEKNDLEIHKEKLENDNLVMFPSSKNFKRSSDKYQALDLDNFAKIKDPLEELLNEGNIEADSDSTSEHEINFDELETVLTAQESQLIAKFGVQIEKLRHLKGPTAWAQRQSLLQAINQRMNYYLGELERYLPGRGIH